MRVHRPTIVAIRDGSNRIFIDRNLAPGDTYRVPNRVGLWLTVIDAGAVEIVLDGTRARIERFEARGGSGRVRLEGDAVLGAEPQADLQLIAESFQLLGRLDRRIVTSGQARLRLDRESLALDGRFGVDEGLVDFTRSDFHAAVRLAERPSAGLEADELMDEWLVVVASPKLFKKFGSLDDRDGFDGIPMLQSRDEPWTRFEKSTAPAPWPAGPATIDDSVSVISAVMEGLGYAPARWSIAANDLDNGNLVLASKTIVPSRFKYWFVCPPAYAELPMVLALRQWMREEAAAFPKPDDWLSRRYR